jgi:hypothetical protein
MLTKVCSKCGKRKRLSEYTPTKQGAGGVRGDCKKCRASQGRSYWQAKYDGDPEFRRTQIKRITEANRRRRQVGATNAADAAMEKKRG